MVNLMQRTCRLSGDTAEEFLSRFFKVLRRPESGILFLASLDIFFFVYPALFTRVEFD